ncbi:T9SS type A sorting domain-containing protein [Aurantibacillus circumpalustris]|uniref:T9SS type A sorting domain-containing protein n=1 Tax=Aurantibacillus circumpalustris TaxID=3036359 RepID=UPI00295BB971|nr:T9SS type A sorting domain-containing protein [Aurantibacillus circumpalustris]
MMSKLRLVFFSLIFFKVSTAQLALDRDTITVIENAYVLKMPWANGLNFANVSNIDLNGDGKKDIVAFDRLNPYGVGRFRCFIHSGNVGEIKYKENWYLSYLFPQVANWAVFKDYNCDGKEDLFCSTNSGIKVYKNTTSNGVLSFQLVKPLIYTDYNPGGNPLVSNLYASSIGVPGIVDIDNDGDLDILTFAPQGIFIELHKNMSVEKNFGCDSLVFENTDNCWGKLSESNCAVNFNACGSNRNKNIDELLSQSKTYHAGSCLACLDSDGDNDIDLIMGDISCNTIEYVHNTGVATLADFTDSTKLYPNYPNKNSTTVAKMNSFPCAYYVDVNADNKKDLIVTPNSYGTENYKSVWLYKNTSLTNTVNFQFEKNNFLQDEMIEVGQNSFPVVFDCDSDGKKDLLIGNYGYYNGSSLNSKLTLYKNIGTTSQPTYSLITRDYASLSTIVLNNNLHLNNAVPTVGDIDSDGDVDIIIGTSSGQVHWLENTAGTNNPCNFSIFHENPFLITTPSSAAAPQLFDLDNDSHLDLLIGMQNGKIAWYRNVGTSSVPSFSLVTSSLGGVDVKGDPNVFGYEGYATPFFYKENGVTNLLVGSFSGSIAQYIVPSIVTNSFTLITKNVNGFNEGSQSTVCYEDVNGDAKRDLIIGNSGGGLNFFSSKALTIGVDELNTNSLTSKISFFPNPTKGKVTINMDVVNFQKGTLLIHDVLGKEIINSSLNATSETFDLSNVDNGVYFITILITSNFQTERITKKILKD